MKKIEKLLKDLKIVAQKDHHLKNLTTLDIGGPAKLYVEITKELDLIKIIKLARKDEVPFLVVGEGSNLLVHERGFGGLIIRNAIVDIKRDGNKVLAKAGTNLQDFVDFLIGRGLAGAEKMSGIPGTVGGAIYGNAGAYGQTISDHLKRIKIFNGEKVTWISRSQAGFGYRESRFKKTNEILLEVEFEFEKGDSKELAKVKEQTITLRQEKYKPEMKTPGSFFKNVLVKDLPREILAKIPKEKIVYGKVPAGYLLEAVDARGKSLGGIKIADYHGNLFINVEKGKASDFYKLANKYKQRVKEKFGIDLEPEVQLIGFD